MSFDVVPPGANVAHLPPRPAPPPDSAAGGEAFAKVYELTALRRGVRDVPPHVWDEVDRAARVAADLAATGRVIRFTEPQDGARVKADLVDAEGDVIRPVSLGEVITIGTTDPPSAA